MSHHIVEDDTHKWVYGWDQHLMSFYLQVHDKSLTKADEDENPNPVIWLGASADTQMYEVEDLVRAARRTGLNIDYQKQVTLYGEKDDGV